MPLRYVYSARGSFVTFQYVPSDRAQTGAPTADVPLRAQGVERCRDTEFCILDMVRPSRGGDGCLVSLLGARPRYDGACGGRTFF